MWLPCFVPGLPHWTAKTANGVGLFAPITSRCQTNIETFSIEVQAYRDFTFKKLITWMSKGQWTSSFHWRRHGYSGNCGFHHGRVTERLSREMFGGKGVNLLFQPPYSPGLNFCEYCLHKMKQTMRCNEHLSQSYTEVAIIDALNNITAAQSVTYFRPCGCVWLHWHWVQGYQQVSFTS